MVGNGVEVFAHLEPRVVGDVVTAIRAAVAQGGDNDSGEVVGLDVVGIHVLIGMQCGQLTLQSFKWQSVAGVDARYAQDADAAALAAGEIAQYRLGVEAATGTCRLWIGASCLADDGTLAIAIDAAGADINDLLRWTLSGAGERGQQVARAPIGVAGVGRWCKVDDDFGDAREATQGRRLIEIADDRRGAHGAPTGGFFPMAQEREQVIAADQQRHQAPGDVAATDQEQPLHVWSSALREVVGVRASRHAAQPQALPCRATGAVAAVGASLLRNSCSTLPMTMSAGGVTPLVCATSGSVASVP